MTTPDDVMVGDTFVHASMPGVAHEVVDTDSDSCLLNPGIEGKTTVLTRTLLQQQDGWRRCDVVLAGGT